MVELRVAESYVSKESFSTALERVEQRMIRIENKIDDLNDYCYEAYPPGVRDFAAVKKLIIDLLQALVKKLTTVWTMLPYWH